MKSFCRIALAASLLLAACSLSRSSAAQATAAGTTPPAPSRFELFGEYGYFHPVNSDIYSQKYTPLPGGVVAGVNGFFNRTWGLEAEYAKFPNAPDYCMSTVQGGVVLRHPLGRLVPYAKMIGGGAQVGPSYAHHGASNPCVWGWAATGGVGLDYVLPYAALRNHLAVRPIEADFHFSNVNYGAQTAPNTYTGGDGQITAYRLSAGLVYRIGATEAALPASYGCEAQPVSVYPGDPVHVTGSVLNLEKKKQAPLYTWASSGGKISGGADGATVDTAGLAAGDYTVTGRVSEGSGPSQHAECSTSFRVNAFEPPTVTCSADPSTVQAGGTATISAAGRSPQNRPLTYSYSASAGQVTPAGATATLATADVPAGAVTVTCNTVDDLGKSASATASVTVVAPPPPPAQPAPQVRNLCSVSFARDRSRPARVDNEGKACLDDVALALSRDADSKLVLVGKHDAGERPETAAQRVLNVKQYLTEEKGIDASRIQLRTGETSSREVDDVLVPRGASWDPAGTTGIDPAQVHRHGEPYGKLQRH